MEKLFFAASLSSTSQSIVPGEDVGVVGAGEGLLQLVQLQGGEGGPVPTLLAPLHAVVHLRANLQTYSTLTVHQSYSTIKICLIL